MRVFQTKTTPTPTHPHTQHTHVGVHVAYTCAKFTDNIDMFGLSIIRLEIQLTGYIQLHPKKEPINSVPRKTGKTTLTEMIILLDHISAKCNWFSYES